MSTLLITGHTGFVGRVLTKEVAARSGRWAIVTLGDHCDVRNRDVAQRIAETKPDAVIHLAARTSVPESFRDVDGYFDVNFNGTLNLLRCLRATDFRGRFVYVGSGDCYGSIRAEDLPVREDHPLRPRNPYAVSKVAAEALCYQWAQTEGLDAVLARPFNHIGPGQDDRFVIAAFAKQIAAIRVANAAPQLVCGNLDVTRDLSDVRDVVAAYIALIERGESGQIYNVGSGRETSIRDVLERLLRLANVDVEVVVDPARVRRDEQQRVRADVAKIRSDTGWACEIPLDDTLRDILSDWMARVNR